MSSTTSLTFESPAPQRIRTHFPETDDKEWQNNVLSDITTLSCSNTSIATLLRVGPGTTSWETLDLDDESFEQALDTMEEVSPNSIRIMYIDGEPNWGEPLSLRGDHFQKLLSKFEVSLRVMDQLRELMGLGSLTVDTDPNLKRYDMWYLLARYEGQNLADLKRLAVYSIIYPASQSAVLICRNTPDDLKRRIEQFSSTDELRRNPFLLHVLITDWVISVIRQRWLLYDSKVMELKGKNSTTYEFFELAKTQRHLEELILTIQTLSSQQKLVYDASTPDANLRSRVERGFGSHLLQCSLLQSRLTSIQQLGKDIVQNTLNFATFEIAKNSQRDSTTMKAIAVITMLTLPGVFVSVGYFVLISGSPEGSYAD
ncbi:hypothetical protein Egran_04991 [Elaphomyces granulatus]|uniref:Uncharacterized protein n=1 Tax=Elaphomyces granulatus TaxID=519963 RepID=A0A232LT38_9EURO|nr:hypothetical protein Egran_04991 [Elaphomyces granulatus]